MDDHTASPSTPYTVSRSCEASRLGGQLLARTYQQVFPEVRRSLVDPKARPTADCLRGTSTAARVAVGA